MIPMAHKTSSTFRISDTRHDSELHEDSTIHSGVSEQSQFLRLENMVWFSSKPSSQCSHSRF